MWSLLQLLLHPRLLPPGLLRCQLRLAAAVPVVAQVLLLVALVAKEAQVLLQPLHHRRQQQQPAQQLLPAGMAASPWCHGPCGPSPKWMATCTSGPLQRRRQRREELPSHFGRRARAGWCSKRALRRRLFSIPMALQLCKQADSGPSRGTACRPSSLSRRLRTLSCWELCRRAVHVARTLQRAGLVDLFSSRRATLKLLSLLMVACCGRTAARTRP